MKNVYFKIAGIQNGNYSFPENIKIGDRVDLVHEKDNKYDPNAVAVFFEGTQLGYVPKASNKHMKPCIKDDMQGFTVVESDIQSFIVSEKITSAVVTWLKNPTSGMSHSIELTLDKTPPYTHKNLTVEYRHYNKDGEHVLCEFMSLEERKAKGLYMSITSFLTHIEDKYMIRENLDRLRQYQSTRTEQHVLDAQAKYGTLMHEFIEYINTGKSKTADKIKKITEGLELIKAEKIVFDDDLMLAGTMDHRAKDVVIDWKSGSFEAPKHKYQISFYCHNEGVSEGRIYYFGVDTKKGYKEVILYQDQIHLGYNFIKNLIK